MSDQVDLQPTTAEVVQAEAEYDLTTVPVCVTEIKSPVRTQALPRKGGSTFTKVYSSSIAQRVLTADHYRASATLYCDAQKMRIAFDKTAIESDTQMAVWPAATPLVVTATTEVWVKVDTADAEVSVMTERWAAGE